MYIEDGYDLNKKNKAILRTLNMYIKITILFGNVCSGLQTEIDQLGRKFWSSWLGNSE